MPVRNRGPLTATERSQHAEPVLGDSMRTACWIFLISALCIHGLGCDTSDAEPDVGSAADMDGGKDAASAFAPRRPAPKLDGSVPPVAKPDAGAPQAGTGAIAPEPEDRDAGADSDGGVEPRGDIRYTGGDGSSCEKAVIILGAANELAGISAEYAWLDEHYPGAMVLVQSLATCNGDWTDILRIRTTAGRTIDVYFNIADFFGKW
jgi:hypothetical protein